MNPLTILRVVTTDNEGNIVEIYETTVQAAFNKDGKFGWMVMNIINTALEKDRLIEIHTMNKTGGEQ